MCTFARSHCLLNRIMGVRKANGSNSGSIRRVLGAYWLFGLAFGSSKNILCMFKIIFIHLPNVANMCICKVFGKHSMSIRHVRKTFRKHASSSRCIRNENLGGTGKCTYAFRTHRMLIEHDERFPIVYSILSEFQYSFRTFSELLVHFQYVPYSFRTPQIDLEHNELFQNVSEVRKLQINMGTSVIMFSGLEYVKFFGEQ